MTERAFNIAYSAQLDSLRAFAVAGVLYSHFWMPQTQWGHWGVRLFFVLSGFLITAILLHAQETAAPGQSRLHIWKAFYIRRALRIFPAYYLLLTVVALSSEEARGQMIWHSLYGSNLLFAVSNDWGYWPLSHLWSLSVEEQFYLLWPFIALLVPGRLLIPVLALLVISAVGFRLALADLPDGPAKYVHVFSALDGFGIGGLLAVLERRKLRGRGLLIGLFGLALLAVGFQVSLQFRPVSAWFYYVFNDLILLAPMAALVLACRMGLGGPWGMVFNNAVLRYLGRISYGIYLFHFPVLALIYESLWALGLQLPAHGAALFLGASIATIMVSALSSALVEIPINRLKQRFSYVRPEVSG